MMYHYTGIENDEGERLFAEHYEDKSEAVKRAGQLESEALVRGWKVYCDETPREGSVLTAPEVDDRPKNA